MRMAYRFAEGRFERLPTLADELVRLPVDVLVTDGAGAQASDRHDADRLRRLRRSARRGAGGQP